MSILVNSSTRVVVQGITGKHGSFHTQKMLEYGTEIVAGVTPGRGGEHIFGLPIFNTVREAVEETAANTSIIYVPAKNAADSIAEAAETGLKLIVCITEGIPVLDMLRVKNVINKCGAVLIGPNCPGVITPGECKLGIMPGELHTKGSIGVISRSGTLTYEAVSQLSACSLGQSTVVGIGGDPIKCFGFIDALKLFENDSETAGVLLIGEIGGNEEEKAAQYIKSSFSKPVAAYITGATAPKGRRMGHAGAIVSGGSGTVQGKIHALSESGVQIAVTPDRMGEAMKIAMERAKSSQNT